MTVHVSLPFCQSCTHSWLLTATVFWQSTHRLSVAQTIAQSIAPVNTQLFDLSIDKLLVVLRYRQRSNFGVVQL